MKKIFLLVTSLVFSVLFAGQALTVFAIGQTTDPIVIENALRGNEYHQTMIIINTEKTDSQIDFVASGDISKWAEFYKLDDFQSPISKAIMMPGEALNVSVLFKVPLDTPNGEYEGFISAVKKADSVEKTEESGAAVSQKIDRKVTIEVNDDEIISFKVSVIPKTYDLEEGEMLNIRLIYDNRGNTSISPQVQIKIKKDDQTVHNSIYPYPENLPLVKPGAIYEIPIIEIPTRKFKGGGYTAELSFSTGKGAVVEKDFFFSMGGVVDEDNNSNSFSSFILRIGGGSTPVGLFFAGGFVLLLSIFLLAKLRKKKARD